MDFRILLHMLEFIAIKILHIVFSFTFLYFHGYITQGIPSLFFVCKISFINLKTAIDFTNDQNAMHRVLFKATFTH